MFLFTYYGWFPLYVWLLLGGLCLDLAAINCPDMLEAERLWPKMDWKANPPLTEYQQRFM